MWKEISLLSKVKGSAFAGGSLLGEFYFTSSSTHWYPSCFWTDFHSQGCPVCNIPSLFPDHGCVCTAFNTQLYVECPVSKGDTFPHVNTLIKVRVISTFSKYWEAKIKKTHQSTSPASYKVNKSLLLFTI